MSIGMLVLTISVLTHWMLQKKAVEEAEASFMKNRQNIQTEEDYYNSLPRTFFYLILMKSVCVATGIGAVVYEVIEALKILFL
jgi:hypothetical protein